VKTTGLPFLLLVFGLCSTPVPLTATVTVQATQSAGLGMQAQLVVDVVNTGPAIAHLGLVFRTGDRWFERHQMTELAGCTVESDKGAFDCGDLAGGETRTYAFQGVATAAGTYHYELALRELVQPFNYVNDHPDGPDTQVWDETVG
jgi:hypothetical protein